MSKKTNTAERAIGSTFSSPKDALTCAQWAINGKKTVTSDEAESIFSDAADSLDLQFKRMDNNMSALALAEIQCIENAKKMMQQNKQIIGQMGDFMSKIDKVMVKDFEAKLCQLERFVAAMQTLDDLKKRGSLEIIIGALK